MVASCNPLTTPQQRFTSGSLEIRVYHSLQELESIQQDWEGLLAKYPLTTTFSTPQWLVPWWKSFGTGLHLRALTFFDAESQLCAFAPFSLSSLPVAKALRLRLLRLMGDGSNDSDNLDIPVLPGYEDQVASAVLHYFDKHRAWDVCELNTLPPASLLAACLRQSLRKRKWASVARQRIASAVPLPETWEQYLERLSSEDRNNLARYTRRLEKRYAVRIYRCTSEDQLKPCLDALFDLHQSRWTSAGQAGSFDSQERRTFYYELSRALMPRDLLDFWLLELDGKIAAAQFAFRHGRTVFQLQEGNDPKRASDRVGFVLRGHVMRQLIAEGIQTYDFLGGALGYKARWGAEARHYLDLHFARPFSLGAAYLQGLSGARTGKEWLRQRLPKGAWQSLHQLNVRLRKPGQKVGADTAKEASDQREPQ
jgi:CelD/BcsL family acetyltransferase involved in cellulose biosynthesis